MARKRRKAASRYQIFPCDDGPFDAHNTMGIMEMRNGRIVAYAHRDVVNSVKAGLEARKA